MGGASGSPARAGVDDGNHPPRRSAGRTATDGSTEPTHLRHTVPVHGQQRGDPAGGVFRVPPV
ncbi:MAG: hypothetical protein R3E39_24570 [Anaerolineae bacterium]